MKHEFTDIMTVGEAAEKWGKSPISVKHLCTGMQGRPARLTTEECRKAGKPWMVTKAGRERFYGPEKEGKE